MPKFAANLSMMFQEVSFLERFKSSKEAGFDAIEFLFPYDYSPEDIAEQLHENDLQQALFNLYPGDWAAGDRGLSIYPDQEEAFQESVHQALTYAKALNCKKLHVMAGVAEAGMSRALHKGQYLKNLQYAADEAAKQNVTVLIEPLNSRDMPGYFLHYTDQAIEIINQVNRPNLKLQLDIYHTQIMEGDLIRKLRDLAPYIGHIQIAGVPDRHEPDIGEVNYPAIFDVIDEIGYTDWVGCEYHPKGNTVEGLSWLQNIA